MKWRNSYLIFLALAFPASLHALEIMGKVQEAAEDSATIITDGDVIPSIGDKVTIFFKLDDNEISVASGQVTQVIETLIKARIENATGQVARDQLARISSDKPQTPPRTTPAMPVTASSEPAPSIAPPPTEIAPIVGEWIGKRSADGLTATYNFKGDGTVTWALKKKGASQRDKGKYRVDYSRTPHKIDIIDPPKSKWDGPGLHGIFEFPDHDSMKIEFGASTKASDRATKFTEAAVVLSRSR